MQMQPSFTIYCEVCMTCLNVSDWRSQNESVKIIAATTINAVSLILILEIVFLFDKIPIFSERDPW